MPNFNHLVQTYVCKNESEVIPCESGDSQKWSYMKVEILLFGRVQRPVAQNTEKILTQNISVYSLSNTSLTFFIFTGEYVYIVSLDRLSMRPVINIVLF